MQSVQSPVVVSLDDFLARPETKPATELIHGAVIPKPMPKGKHSQLTLLLCTAINQVAQGRRLGYALPELRCTFDGRSIVPDVAFFRWDRIPFEEDGEISNDFLSHPDWIIEILSPDQSPNRVIEKIAHCLQQGGELGWLIDPSDRSVLIFQHQHHPQLCRGTDALIPPQDIELSLSADELFGWLKVG